MGTVRHVATLGQPYFAMVAEGVGDLSTLPQFGLAAVALEFRVDALPVQSASADELHPMFAFDHDLQTQAPLLEVGVTPSGRFKALAKSGSTWQTAPSRVSDTSVWHTLEVRYDGASGQWTAVLDGTTDTGTIDGAPQYLVPKAGYNTRLMLFNGRDGLARTGVSIRSAFLTFVGASDTTTLLYTVDRSQDGSLTPTFGGTGPAAIASPCVLSAQWYDPIFSHPWGVAPTNSTDGAYRYGLTTDWARLPRRSTAWTRVAA
jgi:hypothetical protein